MNFKRQMANCKRQIVCTAFHLRVFPSLKFAVCLVSFAFLLTSCHPQPDNLIRASGTLEMTEIYLSPNVAGKVTTLEVREGDSVKTNQQVATLERFDQTRREYERAKRLVPEGGATREQEEKAELAWRDQQLSSPINGIILNRISEPGEVVSPGVPVVVIGDPQNVYLKVYLSEREIGRIVVGQSAEISVDAFPSRKFPGKVTFVSPKAEFTPKNVQTKEERVTQMFAIKVALSDASGALKPGMPADCEIHLN